MSIPHLFRCPISLDIFTDPVTLSTGQTYDRPSIEKWLSDGNLTCPVTMQRLVDTSLVPNHTLRHLIDQWLLSGLDPNHGHKPPRPVEGTGYALARLKQILQSPDTAISTKTETVRKVRILSKESDIGQACLIQLGFFPLMLRLLFQTLPQFEEETELAELALDCVLSLSPSTHLDSLNKLLDDTYLASLVLLFDQGNVNIKTNLCCLLETIATPVETQELCLILGQSRRVMQILVSLLHTRADARASEAAVRAISSLCSSEANRGNAVREGAIDGLVSYLMNCNHREGSKALGTLEVLVGLEAGKKALLDNPNAVHVLVKSVFRVSSSSLDHEGCEHAVASLLIVCCDSAWGRVEAVNAGVFTQLLLLLQSQCSSKAKAKARALLKLLRSMWVRDPGVGKFYHAM